VKMIGSLDTNALLRLILGDIPEQRQAVRALIARNNGQFVVADVAASEAVFALGRYYDMTRSQIATAMHSLMHIKTISCNRPLITTALDDFVAHPSLSFEDCLLAAEARLAEAAPLYTFDKKLAGQLSATILIES